jgi:cysteine desulfurase/selenocysteine lyase
MPPYQGGGDMISSVTFEKSIYNKLPYKFEASTPHVAGFPGLMRKLVNSVTSQIGSSQVQSHQPAEQNVVVQLFHQNPFGAHRIQHL